MIAYQTENGYFFKEVECQISPLDGNYLIPKGAVIDIPPILTVDSEDVSFFDETLDLDTGKEIGWKIVKNPNYLKCYSKVDGSIEYFLNEISDKYTIIPKPDGDFVFYNNGWVEKTKYDQIEKTKLYFGDSFAEPLSDSEIRELLYKNKIIEINKLVSDKISSGFEIDIIGETLIYDSSLTDQFEIDQLERRNIDGLLKAIGADGIKKRYYHTSSQIKRLTEAFFKFVQSVKIKADVEKEYLSENYTKLDKETGEYILSLYDLKNYKLGD